MIDTSDVKRNKLRLRWDLPLRDGFIESFDSIIDYAIDRAKSAADDPEKSVHEYRKSIRRARSLIRLIHDAHADFDRTELNDKLRAAFEPTSALRDADVLRPVIEMWAKLATDESVVERILGSLGEHREEVGSHQVEEILANEIEGLHYCKWALRRQIPEDFGWDHITAGLQKSYRRCKRRRHEAATSVSDLAVHDWRKRTKEIRYQTELFAAGSGIEPITSFNKALADQAQDLGEATDLQIFSDYLAERVEIEGVPDWQARVYEEYLRSLGASVLKSNVFFRPEPKDFASEIIDGIDTALNASDESE